MKRGKYALLLILLMLLVFVQVGCLKEKGYPTFSRASQGEETQIEQKIEEKPIILSFFAMGDNLLHEPLVEGTDIYSGSLGDGQYDFSYMYELWKEKILQSSVSFINQEVISGGDAYGVRGYPQFNVPSALIFDLEKMGFDVVALANNHALDMGVKGVEYALSKWKDTQVVYHGIFDEEEQAQLIPYFEKEGVRFAFLSYTTHTNGIPLDNPWRVSLLTEEKVREDFSKIEDNVDFILVSVHWGWDNVLPISQDQRKFAQLFADLGADVVIGTGPHVVQDIEFLFKGSRLQEEDNALSEHEAMVQNKTVIAYSLGNAASAMHGAFNVLEGFLSLNFVKQGEFKALSDVILEPAVMHYDALEVSAIRVYPLLDYTEDLLKRNVVKFKDGKLSLDYLWNLYAQQISAPFRLKQKD